MDSSQIRTTGSQHDSDKPLRRSTRSVSLTSRRIQNGQNNGRISVDSAVFSPSPSQIEKNAPKKRQRSKSLPGERPKRNNPSEALVAETEELKSQNGLANSVMQTVRKNAKDGRDAKMKETADRIEAMRNARDALGYVNVTGRDLKPKTNVEVLGKLRTPFPRGEKISEKWAYDQVFKSDAQMNMYTVMLVDFEKKRSLARSKQQRSVYSPFSFVDHQKMIAVVFFHSSITQVKTIGELIALAKQLKDANGKPYDLGMAGHINRL